MTLIPGTHLGPYEILSALGAGGMGEVYRARDTKLGRDVALKLLPDAFTHDAERVARFQREAHTLAALNHPNIAGIYGLEESNGVTALVMELVEGDDLSQWIARGAVPLDEALPIAKQIAEALESAHEQGIVHRDLKPPNIKVRGDGTVKVLDFGLAKAMEPASVLRASVGHGPDGAPTMSMSPTITTPAMTQAGMILGTAAYMSPEQARGKAVDKRADIWAFGCVLFEMLTGTRAVAGDDVSDVLASVLAREPEWTRLPATLPPALGTFLKRCLHKDPRQRIHDIADVRLALDGAFETGVPSLAPPAPRRRSDRAGWAVAATLSAVVAVTATVIALRVLSPPPSPSRPVMRLELNLPPGVEFYAGNGESVAVSPDGAHVAFIGTVGGVRQVYVRGLDRVDATAIQGTGTATACFFSSDGRGLGFLTTTGELKKASLGDGLVVPLAGDVDNNSGGDWGPDDRITFVRAGTLWQISAAGGPATQVTRLDTDKGEVSHAWPRVVADGKVILFAVVTGRGRGAAHIEALTLATAQRQILVDPGSFPLYDRSGHLIFFRTDALLAVSFDVSRLRATGSPTKVIEDLVANNDGTPVAALSNAGALVYPSNAQASSQLVWVTREGLERPVSDTSRRYANPRLAPDGLQVLVTVNGDLWVHDTARVTFTRLTSNETAGNSFPVWTPDGTRVVFRTQTGLASIDTKGSGRSQAIPDTSINDYPNSVSPDGATLAFIRLTRDRSADAFVLSLHGEPEPRAVVTGPAYEGGPQFSPDGRWMAYTSDESGASQVYVRPFPGPDRRWPVSTQGGRQVRWNRNGKELFYRDANKMMVVDVRTSPELALSPPRLLFDQRYAFGVSLTTPNYDVSADGQRFLMVKDQSDSGRLSVVLNWTEELKRIVPVP